MQKGVTFSHRALIQYGCEVLPAYTELLSWHCDVIRLCVYWDEVETQRGTYAFSQVERLVELANESHQKIILCIGAKSPRWPEFYWPNWLKQDEREERLLFFLQKSIEHFKKYDNILFWQIENEPLDPSGPNQEVIALSLLQREVEIFRELDGRPVFLTAWGNDEKRRETVKRLLPLADVVGIDLYPKQFAIATPFGSLHRGPDRSQKELQSWIAQIQKPMWIAELQAEPWEKDEQAFWRVWPQSISPRQLKKNFLLAESLAVEGMLAWGYEYWWASKERGNPELLAIAKAFLSPSLSSSREKY